MAQLTAWADMTSGGSLTTRRFYADAVDAAFARINGTDEDWLYTDRLGSVRDIVDYTGDLISHRDWDSYGNLVAETGSGSDRYGWTGREWEAEAELQYNRARYYDPTIGRWISQDPIGFDAGDGNLYRYVRNHSVGSSDPSGLQEFDPESYRAWSAFWKSIGGSSGNVSMVGNMLAVGVSLAAGPEAKISKVSLVKSMREVPGDMPPLRFRKVLGPVQPNELGPFDDPDGNRDVYNTHWVLITGQYMHDVKVDRFVTQTMTAGTQMKLDDKRIGFRGALAKITEAAEWDGPIDIQYPNLGVGPVKYVVVPDGPGSSRHPEFPFSNRLNVLVVARSKSTGRILARIWYTVEMESSAPGKVERNSISVVTTEYYPR